MDGVNQKYFKGKSLFAFLSLISIFAPISTDIYLPSLPNMIKYFSTSQEIINLTLSAFFVCYSIGMLIWGPLSDKFGRKYILTIGMAVYTLASFTCIWVNDISQLVLLRALQGLFGSASVVVAGAIIKDTYESKERETAIAIVQSIAVLAPMVAPMIGALIVSFSDQWQLVFVLLTVAGALTFLAIRFFTETHVCEDGYTVTSSFLDLQVALSNYKLTSLLIIFSLPMIPFLSYIVLSSYIYMKIFHLNAKDFSIMFSLNASCSIIAPVLYIKFLRKYMQPKNLVAMCFIVMSIAGCCLYLWGSSNEYVFLATLMPASLAGSILRPPGANMMLSKHKNAGTTSALMGFSAMLLGGVGTLISSLGWSNLIEFLGGIFVIVGAIGLLGWLFVYERILK
mgnify:CR=1 FL=1